MIKSNKSKTFDMFYFLKTKKIKGYIFLWHFYDMKIIIAQAKARFN